jgi:endonuclease/exonuclease/phosphatase family metal-dependent hydrolase
VSSADRALGIWGRLHWVGLAALVAALGLCLMPGVADAKKKNTVKVGTYNLYLGSSLNNAVAAAAEGEGVPGPAGQAQRLKAFDHFADQVGVILKNVETNDFNIRAKTIAQQIKKNKTDLVGLQEAALYRLEIPTDGGGPGGLNPAATFATVPFIDYLDVLLNALNKKALSKKECKTFKEKHPGKQCYRGYYLAPAPVEADIEFPGDFDNDPGPNGIGGEGPAFNATSGFPPCDTQSPKETNPGGDDTGVELGDPGPPNPFGIDKDPVTGQPTPWDWNGDSSSNTAHGGTRNCGPDTVSGDFDTSPPPSGGFQYASDCPDNNPIGGAVDPEQGAADKSDTTSSCLFHGIDGDARLTIRDAIIARKGAGVKTSNPTLGHFSDANTLKIPVFGGATAIPFTRGWAAVDANVRGKKFHFIDTHLESASAPVKDGQAGELVAPGGPASQPNTILVGDLNSDPSFPNPEDPGAGGTAYNRIAAGGFAPLTGPGNTYGHAQMVGSSLLNNPNDNTFTKRIDWILTNNPSIRMKSSFVLNKFANGLWGSDHGGVISVLRVPGGKKK